MQGPALPVAFLFLTLAFAGCLGGDDEPTAASDDCTEFDVETECCPDTGACTFIGDGNDTEEAPAPYVPPHHPNDGAYELLTVELDSAIGHKIPVSVYKPAIAGNDTQFPVLLHSHGFTGSRWTGDQAVPYIEAGFAVVSFDERGHGDARDDSTVTFMHPEAEVLDVIAVIDHIASLDWVLKDPDDPADPVLGTMGGSYGGAFQLMTSIFDDRIDAMVPEITWFDITEALAPNGAIKSGWVDLFYAAGNGFYLGSEVAGAFGDGYRAQWEDQAGKGVVFNNDFHLGFAWATASNELPAGQGGVIPDLVTLFQEASPAYHEAGLDVPTLLIQGMPDTLFPLNQAVQNYQRITENGAPVHLYTHNQGHIAPGLQGSAGGTPCGGLQELTVVWHQKWLLDLDVDLGPAVCISLEDGTAVQGDTFPLPSTEMTEFPIGGPFPIAQAVAGTLVPLLTIEADVETTVAGIPRLSGTIATGGADAIVYFSFQTMNTDGVLEHIVDDQVRPLRVPGPSTGASFELDLGGIGTKLETGDQMFLVVSSIEPMYFGNSERLPAGVVLDDLTLELPIVADPVPFEG